MANVNTLPNLQSPSRSPSRAQTLPSEAVLDALKMMLIGASLTEVLTSITRLIEAHSEGMLCSIFLLDEDGLHLRYGVAPNLPQAYQAATDGTCIGPNVGSCGAAAYLRQPVFVSDILSHPNWTNFKPPVDGFLLLDKAKFPASFAADVSLEEAEFMADSQVPWGVNALGGTISESAWKAKPSWYLLTTEDRMLPPDAQRLMSKRAGRRSQKQPRRVCVATTSGRSSHRKGGNRCLGSSEWQRNNDCLSGIL